MALTLRLPCMAARTGYERIPFHADAAAAALEPEKHLVKGRHGEWAPSSLGEGHPKRPPVTAGTWGVTLLPPGMDEGTADKAYVDTIRMQHGR